MRIYIFYISFLFWFSAGNSLVAQQLKAQYDEIYNLDHELYNGLIFTEVYRIGVAGNQFFLNEDFQFGKLGLNDQVYDDQNLNYDVFRQKLLLSFENEFNARVVIEVPLLNAQFFYLENKYFEVLPWEDDSKKIFQVFGNEGCKILIEWNKSLSTKSYSGNYNRKFSDLKKKVWFLKNGEYHAVKNNRSFIELFEIEKQDDIEKWLKSNRIKIQKADDASLQMLAEYCSQL